MAIEVKHDEEEKVDKTKSTKVKGVKQEVKVEEGGFVEFVFSESDPVNFIRPSRFAESIWIPSNRRLKVDENNKALIDYLGTVTGAVRLS